jgi:antitoxin component of MazEF toxin-antitoxin module
MHRGYETRRPPVTTSKVRKSGNSYIVTIPKAEVERLQLREGQLVTVEVHPVEVRPKLAPDVREAFEASWERNEAGYRYLAGR